MDEKYPSSDHIRSLHTKLSSSYGEEFQNLDVITSRANLKHAIQNNINLCSLVNASEKPLEDMQSVYIYQRNIFTQNENKQDKIISSPIISLSILVLEKLKAKHFNIESNITTVTEQNAFYVYNTDIAVFLSNISSGKSSTKVGILHEDFERLIKTNLEQQVSMQYESVFTLLTILKNYL